METNRKELKLKELTDDFYTGINSLKIGDMIDQFILDNLNSPIAISMFGIENVSPSFVNGAFLYIIDLYGVQYFREYIKITSIAKRLLPEIKQSIDFHIAKKEEFFGNFNTNTLFVAIDGSQESRKTRKNIFDAITEKGNLLSSEIEIFNEETKTKIQKSNAIIGIWFNRNDDYITNLVNFAISINKPCLIFCHKNIDLVVPNELKQKVQLMRFDEQNILLQTRELNKIILAKQINNKALNQNITKNDMLAWSALGVAGAFLLATLLQENKK